MKKMVHTVYVEVIPCSQLLTYQSITCCTHIPILSHALPKSREREEREKKEREERGRKRGRQFIPNKLLKDAAQTLG
jgi:hypothetical protein